MTRRQLRRLGAAVLILAGLDLAAACIERYLDDRLQRALVARRFEEMAR